MADTVGAGSEVFGVDGMREDGGWVRGAEGLRGIGQRAIREFVDEVVGNGGERTRRSVGDIDGGLGAGEKKELLGKVPRSLHLDKRLDNSTSPEKAPNLPQIFRNLTIYINGSTYPLISDHKLKRLIVSHGAHLSIALGRRTVTHVILGTPNHVTAKGGAGGGLASSKIQKEITTTRGKGIKFVGVEWVLESVKAGKRLPEARFGDLKMVLKGQGSVLGAFGGDGLSKKHEEGKEAG